VHPVHALEPDEGENVPEVHNVHMLAPEKEYEPAEHDLQVEDVEVPVDAEYVPAVHLVQLLDE
jgi:hypothetical protein